MTNEVSIKNPGGLIKQDKTNDDEVLQTSGEKSIQEASHCDHKIFAVSIDYLAV